MERLKKQSILKAERELNSMHISFDLIERAKPKVPKTKPKPKKKDKKKELKPKKTKTHF